MFALSFWEICVKKTTENRWQADFSRSRGGRTWCCPLGALTLAATQCVYSLNQNKAPEQREKREREEKKWKADGWASLFYFRSQLDTLPRQKCYDPLRSGYQSEPGERSLSWCVNLRITGFETFWIWVLKQQYIIIIIIISHSVLMWYFTKMHEFRSAFMWQILRTMDWPNSKLEPYLKWQVLGAIHTYLHAIQKCTPLKQENLSW